MKDWKAELGFEIVKHEPEGQMPIYLLREDFGDDREATITERVLWDALQEKPASGEPDMKHPKIQALIGGKARREIELQLVEQLLDDPDCDLSAMDMEYWHGLHDKLREKLLAQQPAASVEPVAWMYQNSNTEREYLVWQKGTGGRNWRPLYTAQPAPPKPPTASPR